MTAQFNPLLLAFAALEGDQAAAATAAITAAAITPASAPATAAQTAAAGTTALPANVKLLTLQAVNPGAVLVRDLVLHSFSCIPGILQAFQLRSLKSQGKSWKLRFF
jgi:hypothetical protein